MKLIDIFFYKKKKFEKYVTDISFQNLDWVMETILIDLDGGGLETNSFFVSSLKIIPSSSETSVISSSTSFSSSFKLQKWPLYCPQGSGTLRQQL